MSFNSLKRRKSERYNEVQVLVNFIRSSSPKTAASPTPLDLKIVKGLFYVHLYAAFEKTVNDTVETTLTLISEANVKNNHLAPEILPLVVSDKLKSIKDSSPSKLFIKSSEMFSVSSSKSVTPINETIFYSALQNVWVNTILEIMAILGITSFTFDTRTTVTINEIVDKRNAIAHGRDSAASVGEKQDISTLQRKMEIMSEATDQIIAVLEEHYGTKRFIKSSSRRYY